MSTSKDCDTNNDESLYDDLKTLSAATTTTATISANNDKKQLQHLKEENEKLKRNIGTLYRTAKKELERKDERLRQLEIQLEQQQQH
mmetsp:Transcript_4802/g.4526  ORF Transcript_4802/g.4526 Transcript_4802/m.4526 type:complete len:87 (+) Transcript_4802:269-529(+)